MVGQDGAGGQPHEFPGFEQVVPLDEGGFGSVFRAIRSSTGGIVAVKVLDQIENAESTTLERRINREIAALVALKGHPNVVQVEEMFLTQRGPAMVMEYMDGGSVLADANDGVLASERVAEIGIAVANALEAAHRAGIVHRDVKPRNVLHNSFGQIKLCDFGIAALDMPKVQQTRTASLSLHYASPEELDDAEDVGPPTDIYSLGASLYHLLNGRPPSFRAMRTGAEDNTIARPGAARLDNELRAVCQQCLRNEASSRPSAAAVRDELTAALNPPSPEATNASEAPAVEAGTPVPSPESGDEFQDRTVLRSEIDAVRPPSQPTVYRPGADGLPTEYSADWWRN